MEAFENGIYEVRIIKVPLDKGKGSNLCLSKCIHAQHSTFSMP